jgi:RNA polymerase sigma factor (TIGR02999 family)
MPPEHVALGRPTTIKNRPRLFRLARKISPLAQHCPSRPSLGLYIIITPFSNSAIMSEVTRILSAIEQGDPHAAERLLPLVYDELRKLAAQKLAQEKQGQTLQATALVHEAYVRLVDVDKAQCWDSRGHFFAAAAEAIRRILVERARRKKRVKHGGGRRRVNLEAVAEVADKPADDIEALDVALARLEQVDASAAQLVKLRFFAGLTMPQAAQALDIPLRSAERNWKFARTWLLRELDNAESSNSPPD